MVKKAALPEILSKLKWGENYDFHIVKIYYIHRGAPDDYMIMYGAEIEDVKGGFIIKKDGTYIPLHRVFLVKYEGKTLYKNERKFPPKFWSQEKNGGEEKSNDAH